jgi:predicted RNA-binding Zn-ribbon protein involved in translation (DUF1610 family)
VVVSGIGTFNSTHLKAGDMSLEFEHYCPNCDEDRIFYRAASTTLHLGEKVKWHCPDCDYGFVRVDGEIDTSEA